MHLTSKNKWQSTVLILLLVVVTRTLAQPMPVDYVGTAPLPDKETLGNMPAPGEQLYTGTVNPGALVPDPNGRLEVGPVSSYDGRGGHMRGSGYRYEDDHGLLTGWYVSTAMGFYNVDPPPATTTFVARCSPKLPSTSTAPSMANLSSRPIMCLTPICISNRQL
jgi:hypothetical protein